MFVRRGARHVCFMCAHAGRAFTSHSTALRVPRTVSNASTVACSSTFSTRAADAAPVPLTASEPLESTPESAPSKPAPKPKRTRSSKSSKKSQPSVVDPDAPVPERQPSKSETFLRSLEENSNDPTLEDLQRFKRHRPDLSSSEYETTWNAVVDDICKSFSRAQLRAMAEEIIQGTTTRLPSTRLAAAQLIVEKSWGWRHPADVSKEVQERTQIHSQTYRIAPNELFLMLGREGSDMLRMSMQLHVRISVSMGEETFSLRVEGLQDDIGKVEQILQYTKDNIHTEIIDDPFPEDNRDFILRIAKISGAFLEDLPDRKIRLTAKRDSELASAKRLVARAAAIDNRESSIPLLVHRNSPHDIVTMFPRRYALYPFLAPRTLLWTMGTAGAFRARKVSEWMSNDEEYSSERGLSTGKIITFTNHDVDLRRALLEKIPMMQDGQSRQISALLGNILFTSKASTVKRASLNSPLEEPVIFSQLLNWVHNTSQEYKSTFVPDVPAALLTVAPSPSTPFNKLVYRTAVPDQTLANDSKLAPGFTKTITLDLVIPEMNIAALEAQNVPSMDLESVECKIGVENAVDVMMPDRPMDIRFSVFDFETLKIDSLPIELADYTHGLKAYFADPDVAQPDPPLHITHDGTEYTLDTSSSVRQTVEEFCPPKGYDWGMDDVTEAVTESAIDFEGSQKASHCQIVCKEPGTELGWRQFLMHCDRLSMKLPRPVASMSDTILLQDLDEIR